MRFKDVAYYLKRAEEAIDPAVPDVEMLRDACFIARQYMDMLSKDFMIIAKEAEDGGEANVLNEDN